MQKQFRYLAVLAMLLAAVLVVCSIYADQYFGGAGDGHSVAENLPANQNESLKTLILITSQPLLSAFNQGFNDGFNVGFN